MSIQADRLFANCVDQIALAGRKGIKFLDALTGAYGSVPDDEAMVTWVVGEIESRTPELFCSTNFRVPLDELHFCACEALRNRALGYNVLEHGTLQEASMRMLEIIGQAGPNGILQSDLGPLLNLNAIIVHHYLNTLIHRELVAKKKVVVMKKKNINSHTSSAKGNDVSHAIPDAEIDSSHGQSGDAESVRQNGDGNGRTSTSVVYSAVIVLSRFEAFIANVNLTQRIAISQHADQCAVAGAPPNVAANAHQQSIQHDHSALPPSDGDGSPQAMNSRNSSAQRDNGYRTSLDSHQNPSDPALSLQGITVAEVNGNTTSTNPNVSNEPVPEQQPAGPDFVDIIDQSGDQRLHRIMEKLQRMTTCTDRELKMICMPDSEKPPDVSLKMFRRKRHRVYRTQRSRLQRLGLVEVVKRQCRSVDGKPLGMKPCLTITKLGRRQNAIDIAFRRVNQKGGYNNEPQLDGNGDTREGNCNADDGEGADNTGSLDDIVETEGGMPTRVPGRNGVRHYSRGGPNRIVMEIKSSTQLPNNLAVAFNNYKGPAMSAEINIVDQVFNVLKKAGIGGISVPELDAYFDCGTGLCGVPQKRLRNIMKLISLKEAVVEYDLYVGKMMFKRFVLGQFVDENDRKFTPSFEKGNRSGSVGRKGKHKSAITTLGEQRQELILEMLNDRKVVVANQLGREVANMEGSGIVRVDCKVMRRILSDLIAQGKIKVIDITVPASKSNHTSQPLQLVALPNVSRGSFEVRHIVDKAIAGTIQRNKCSLTGKSMKKQRSENDNDLRLVLDDESRQSSPAHSINAGDDHLNEILNQGGTATENGVCSSGRNETRRAVGKSGPNPSSVTKKPSKCPKEFCYYSDDEEMDNVNAPPPPARSGITKKRKNTDQISPESINGSTLSNGHIDRVDKDMSSDDDLPLTDLMDRLRPKQKKKLSKGIQQSTEKFPASSGKSVGLSLPETDEIIPVHAEHVLTEKQSGVMDEEDFCTLDKSILSSFDDPMPLHDEIVRTHGSPDEHDSFCQIDDDEITPVHSSPPQSKHRKANQPNMRKSRHAFGEGQHLQPQSIIDVEHVAFTNDEVPEAQQHHYNGSPVGDVKEEDTQLEDVDSALQTIERRIKHSKQKLAGSSRGSRSLKKDIGSRTKHIEAEISRFQPTEQSTAAYPTSENAMGKTTINFPRGFLQPDGDDVGSNKSKKAVCTKQLLTAQAPNLFSREPAPQNASIHKPISISTALASRGKTLNAASTVESATQSAIRAALEIIASARKTIESTKLKDTHN